MKWRTGLILQYGNLSLLSVCELDHRGIFKYDKDKKRSSSATENIYILREGQWKKNDRERVYGVNIETYDIYPILKYPEVKRRYQKVGLRSRGGASYRDHASSMSIPKVDVMVNGESPQASISSDRRRMGNLKMDQIDSEFEKLLKMRQDNSGRAGSGSSLDSSSGRVSPNPLASRHNTGQ